MEKLHPAQLETMLDVTKYWRQCLDLLTDDHDDNPDVAGYMVGVVSNGHGDEWGRPGGMPDAHPAYALIFELAADLEILEDTTKPTVAAWRAEQWQCIRALVAVLEKQYRCYL